LNLGTSQRAIWIVSSEGFIITKLARFDRGVSDEQDIRSVLVNSKLDEEYLEQRAKAVGVLGILNTIRKS
jgi:hypothetical protein